MNFYNQNLSMDLSQVKMLDLILNHMGVSFGRI